MLNELYQIRKSLESWGISIEEAKGGKKTHGGFKKLPTSGKFVLVKIGKNGTVLGVDELVDITGKMYYVESPKAAAPSFKFPKNHSAIAVMRQMKLLLKLAEQTKMSKKKGILAFHELAERIAKQPEILSKEIVEIVGEKIDEKDWDVEKGVYVLLDVSDWNNYPNEVQTDPCYKAIVEEIVNVESSATAKSTKTDFMGNPDAGWERANFKQKAAQSDMFLFSRNRNNGTFIRYGWQENETCKAGYATRAEVNDICEVVMHPDKEYKENKSGFWYVWRDGGYSYLVISTLAPMGDENVLESSDENLSFQEYQDRVNQFLSMLLEQKNTHPDIHGIVIVIQRPAKGACAVRYQNRCDGDFIYQQTIKWNEGMRLLPSGRWKKAPSIKNLPKSFNNYWIRGKNLIGKNSFLNKEFSMIKINDMYDLFFDKMEVVENITKLFALRHVPMWIECSGNSDIESPYALQLLVPTANILLYKNGLTTRELVMNEWSFCLGRIMQEANNIHKAYFTTRGYDPPNRLIGHKFVGMAYRNPQAAMGQFFKEFQVYRNWAENFRRKHPNGNGKENSYFSLRDYQNLCNQVRDLTNGELPITMTAKNQILLGTGYDYYKPRENEQKEPNKEQESI